MLMQANPHCARLKVSLCCAVTAAPAAGATPAGPQPPAVSAPDRGCPGRHEAQHREVLRAAVPLRGLPALPHAATSCCPADQHHCTRQQRICQDGPVHLPMRVLGVRCRLCLQ